MAFIKLTKEVANAGEAQAVPGGNRYNLRIAGIEYNSEKNNYKIDIIVENPPADISEPYPLAHWISIPAEGDDPEKAKNKWRFTRRFLFLFGIPYSEDGFDDSNLEGAVAKDVLVNSETYKDRNNQDKQSLKLDLPQVPKEFTSSFDGNQRAARAKTARH